MISSFRIHRISEHFKNSCRTFKSNYPKRNNLFQKRMMSDIDMRSTDTITTIDCSYMDLPYHSAAYLIKEGNEAAFVDNNTNNSVPALLKALEQNNLTPEQVKYIIITHIHLDHAGGTSLLASKCPNATILAHPRAARHLIDPSKIIESASMVYGEENFKKLYGEINPIEKEKVMEVKDGERLYLGSRPLDFHHVRGHANHHFVVYDSFSRSVFTGDAFGISYRHYFKLHQKKESEIQTAPIVKRLSSFLNFNKEQLKSEKDFIFPSTSPIDFDPLEAHKSVDLIVNTKAERAYLTHFGVWDDMKKGAEQMHFGIQMHENIFNAIEVLLSVEGYSEQQAEEYALSKLKKFFTDQLITYNINENSSEIWKVLESDIKLNAQGLVVAAKKRVKDLKFPKYNG